VPEPSADWLTHLLLPLPSSSLDFNHSSDITCWAEAQPTQEIKEEETEKRTQIFNVVRCLKTYSTAPSGTKFTICNFCTEKLQTLLNTIFDWRKLQTLSQK